MGSRPVPVPIKGFVVADDVLLAAGVRGTGDDVISSIAAILISNKAKLKCHNKDTSIKLAI